MYSEVQSSAGYLIPQPGAFELEKYIQTNSFCLCTVCIQSIDTIEKDCRTTFYIDWLFIGWFIVPYFQVNQKVSLNVTYHPNFIQTVRIS